jgi:indoleamine 2,3-dioxygenase
LKWNIPSLSREPIRNFDHVEDIVSILKSYEIDPARGFLPPQDPCERIGLEKYFIWEDVADELPKLLGVRLPQVREILLGLPLLSTTELQSSKDLYRAHFLLSLFAHAYVWGGIPVVDYIPENIAVPLWEVSCRLDAPPILCYFDIVLYNWRRLDEKAAITMANIGTLNNFFDGRDESWFYLITVEIEAMGAEGIIPVYQTNRDIKNCSFPLNGDASGCRDFVESSTAFLDSITRSFEQIAAVISNMTQSLAQMKEGCDPYIFFHRVRPFLSGWKSNPAVPNGVRYIGVREKWDNRQTNCDSSKLGNSGECPIDQFPFQEFSGGSAAQSSLLPLFDMALGVDHSAHDAGPSSNRFLYHMRQYMPKPHRKFLEDFEKELVIRPFILKLNSYITERKSQLLDGDKLSPAEECCSRLLSAYDLCLINLSAFRSGHINLVAEYIIAQQKLAIQKSPSASSANGGVDGIHGTAGGKGTGGTELMKFLKPIRNNINETVTSSSHIASKDSSERYSENDK